VFEDCLEGGELGEHGVANTSCSLGCWRRTRSEAIRWRWIPYGVDEIQLTLGVPHEELLLCKRTKTIQSEVAAAMVTVAKESRLDHGQFKREDHHSFGGIHER